MIYPASIEAAWYARVLTLPLDADLELARTAFYSGAAAVLGILTRADMHFLSLDESTAVLQALIDEVCPRT